MLFSFFCARRHLLFVWLESGAGCNLMGGNAICLLRRVGPALEGNKNRATHRKGRPI